MVRFLRAAWKPVGAFASWGACFFIGASLFGLSWAIASVIRDPGEPATIISTDVAGVPHPAPGLTYTGLFGVALASAQWLIVAAAAVATFAPPSRGVAPRRLGHLVLCAWAGLWAYDFIRVASLDGLALTRNAAACVCVLAACTLLRAIAGLRRRPQVSGVVVAA